MTEVSIIVPVYNGEKLLPRCLDSLLGQTLADVEILCVDDASTDGTGRVLAEYAARDARVRVITHRTNMTAFVSRNDGIRAAQGRYILFVDGDDELLPAACAELTAQMRRRPADILQFGAEVVNAGGLPAKRIASNQKALEPWPHELSGREVFLACFRDRRYSFSLWGRMYSAALCKTAVEDLEDKAFPKAQDVLLFWMLSWYARSYRSVPERYYRYYFGDGFSGDNVVSLPKFQTICTSSLVAREIEDFMVRQGAADAYRDVIDATQDRLRRHNLNILIGQVAPPDQPEGFRLLLDAWDAPGVLADLARKYQYDYRDAVRMFDGFRVVARPAPRPCRTVGLYYFSVFNGGVQRVVAQLAQILVRAGYKVVLFLEEEPREDEFLLPREAERVTLPVRTSDGEENYLPRARAWERLLREHPVDVMIYNAWLNSLLPWDMLMIRRAGAKFVVHTHSVAFMPFVNLRPLALSIPSLYHMADGVVVLSRTDARYFSKFNGHTYVVRNPVPAKLLSVKPSTLDHGVIVWIGRLATEKQPLDAVRIMQLVHSRVPDAKLRIVGSSPDGAMEETLRASIAEAGLEDVVTLTGFCGDVSGEYGGADLFLSTSAYEGYSMTLQESRCFGLPCVSYDMPYLELYRIPDSGLVTVPPGDVNEAAGAIVRLLRDDAYRRAMGRDARRSVEELGSSDLTGVWRELLDDLNRERQAVVDQDGEEALMYSTMLDFLGRSADPQPDTLQTRYAALPPLLRKACFAWHVVHDLGWKRLGGYVLTKLRLKR